ncbi:MAG: ATP-binding protein [Patescibacteria group bacterium]|jgi:signal transduction histidine kinase|nr:ATP-binding protein [Patescibacteria group bacterium]
MALIFPYALSALINALTSLILGTFVVVKNFRNKVNLTFGLFAFSVAFWSIGYYLWQMSGTSEIALFWCRVLMAGAIFIPIFYFHFVLALIGLLEKKRLVLVVGYVIFISFFFLNFTSFFVNRVEPRLYFKFWPLPGPAYHGFLILWFLYVAYSTYLLYQKYKNSSGTIRQQIKYVFLGMVIGFAGGSTNYLLWYGIPIPPVANILVSVYVGSIAYAIAKYRLMDIRFFARKAFIYFGMALFTYLMFYFVAWLYLAFADGIFTSTSYLTGLIIAPFFVFFFYLVNHFLKLVANKYFFASLYNYQETINKLTRELNYYTDLNKIIDSIVETIKNTMQLDRAGVLLINQNVKPVHYQIAKVIGFNEHNGISLVQDNFLTRYLESSQKPLVREELALLANNATRQKDKESFEQLAEHMKRIEASLCLPLTSNTKLIGIIVLGSKASRDAYTNEDLELLSTLSLQAAIAIDNARLYQEVQNFNKNLQQKVDIQTQEITKKNQYLQELLKMKNEFLNIASHQLKTPISITRGYLSMILDGTIKEQAKQQDALEKAMGGINRLNETVKNFLDASDLEGKEMELEIAKTDILKLIEDLIAAKKILAENKGLVLEFIKPKEKIPSFNLDGSRLTEAISNLIDNAIFYTNEGKVCVSLNVSNNEIIISIQDTGIGISPSEQKNLFNKFRRGKRAILAKPDGSGLGLYICKKIVELHKGKIVLESAVGQGTKFIIQLPTNLKALK